MARKKKKPFIDMSRVESEKYEPGEEVRREFDEAAQLGSPGQLIEKISEHHFRLRCRAVTLTQPGKMPMWAKSLSAAEIQLLIKASWKIWVRP